MQAKQYDFTVFGATSFVGKILTKYLVSEYGVKRNLKWAIAGRSEDRLNSLKQDLGEPDLPVLIADSNDQVSLEKLCKLSAVIVSTVGPYALYGDKLIEACVENGTDYCDLTGEVQWVKQMIDEYHVRAQSTGARIINCCGFDSIPSDLGVYYLQNQAKKDFGSYCSQVKMRVRRMKGEFSGGTVASLLNIVEEASNNPELRKSLADPYLLCPSDHPFKSRQSSNSKTQFDSDSGSWIAPFVMAGVNTRVVHRSNALQNYVYGKEFLYDEAITTGKGVKGVLGSVAITGVIGSFLLGASLSPARWVLKTFCCSQTRRRAN